MIPQRQAVRATYDAVIEEINSTRSSPQAMPSSMRYRALEDADAATKPPRSSGRPRSFMIPRACAS